MGITTPFPEPESEELRRFAVRSGPEIIGVLNALLSHGIALNAYFGSGSDCEAAWLIAVDEPAGRIAFGTGSGEGTRRLAAARLVTLVGFLDEVKVQFTATGAVPASHSGDSVLTATVPVEVIRLQRRAVDRVRPDPTRPAVCRVRLTGSADELEPLRVLDIGIGGLAVLTYPERLKLAVGDQIEGCRLDLPGIGGAKVTLGVRHFGPSPEDVSVLCCGCEFADLSPATRAMLLRYVEARGAKRRCPAEAEP